ERRHRLGAGVGGVRRLGHRGVGEHGRGGGHRHLEHLHPAAEGPAPGVLRMVKLPPLTIGGRRVVPDVQGEPDAQASAAVQELLSDADALDRRCRAAMGEQVNSGEDGAVLLYVAHHVDELQDLASHFDFGDTGAPTTIATDAFLTAMYVRSVRATPDSDRYFLHVDYTIDEAKTQYVLSVVLDRRGTVTSLDMES